jgi:hypothetical protein
VVLEGSGKESNQGEIQSNKVVIGHHEKCRGGGGGRNQVGRMKKER